ALFIAVVAAWVGSMRSSRIRPSQALAETAVERGRPGGPRLLLGVVALAGGVTLCLVSARASGDDAAGIAVGTVFTLVVAVAFLAPVLIRLAAAVAGPLLRAFGAPGRLAAATTGASTCRLAAVLSGLVLAVGLGGSLWFVPASQQHVAAAQTRAGLLADHVVTGPAPGLPPGVAAAVRATPGVSAATGLVRRRHAGGPARGRGLPARSRVRRDDPAAGPARRAHRGRPGRCGAGAGHAGRRGRRALGAAARRAAAAALGLPGRARPQPGRQRLDPADGDRGAGRVCGGRRGQRAGPLHRRPPPRAGPAAVGRRDPVAGGAHGPAGAGAAARAR